VVRSQTSSTLTIAGLARAAGVGVETVRYYQRRGLLETPQRPGAPGHGSQIRRYTGNEVRRLRFIRAAQAAGFTLEQIGELIALDASEDRARAQALADARLAALDAKIAELTAARGALQRLSAACHNTAGGPCPILTAFDSEL
jgi:MerR family transcriptional regulator, mercuric resistance operon regulatory protein